MQDYKSYQKPTQEGETFIMTLKSTNGTSEAMSLEFSHRTSKGDVWYIHFGRGTNPNFKIIVKGGSMTYIHYQYNKEFGKVETEIYSEPSFDITTAQGMAHIKHIFDSYWKDLSESMMDYIDSKVDNNQ